MQRSLVGLITLSGILLSLMPSGVSSASTTSSGNGAAGVVVATTETARALAARDDYSKLPLSFERNDGQTHRRVKFLSRAPGYTLFLTSREAVLKLVNAESNKSAVLRMKMLRSNSNPLVEGQKPLAGRVNYLNGNDRSKWNTNVPTFREVRYREVWPGIDIVWYGKGQQLEYDFIVQPGADVKQIRLGFAGADSLRVDEEGKLRAITKVGEVVQHAPVLFQETSQGRQPIMGKYVLKNRQEIGFEIGPYDESKPLVIDPLLIYSTYVGGFSTDRARDIAVNTAGEAFITGSTGSPDFPLRNPVPGNDPEPQTVDATIFITKLTADGSDLVYSTLIRTEDDDLTLDDIIGGTLANAIAVTSDGKAAITGAVQNDHNKSDFPVTQNAYQRNGFCLGLCGVIPNRFIDSFVLVLNSTGNDIFYSTFFGGGAPSVTVSGVEIGKAIAIDAANRIYITGATDSNNLPTKNAFQSNRQGESDAFIAVFNPAASNGNDTLLYSSYLGGDNADVGRAVAVDSSRNAYVGGSTASTDLETKAPSGQVLPPLQATYRGGVSDGFVAKIDTASAGDSSLTYLSYFGGNSEDRIDGIAVDTFQRAYIAGLTKSGTTFPLLNAFDTTQSNGEGFVAKLNADGTALFYCSYLGGTNGTQAADFEGVQGLAIDRGGNVYVVGKTTATSDFPVSAVSPPFPANLQGTAFLAKIEATVSSTSPAKLLYSTTFGGSTASAAEVDVDPKGNVYFVGTAGNGLPTTAGVFQPTFNGGSLDGFVAKVAGTLNDTIGVFQPSSNQFLLRNSNTAGPADRTVNFGVAGDLPIVGDWDGNGVDDPGVFRPSTAQFLLAQPVAKVITTITLNFGQAGDLPVAGDWNGDGIDTVGVFRPSTNQWILTNGPNTNNTTPPVNFDFVFGQVGDTPIVGDWNGDTFDTPGLFRNGIAQFILSNGFLGTTDITPFTFGQLGSLAMSGDWNGDGIDTVGVLNPGLGQMTLNNVNATANGVNDFTFAFGQNGDLPLGGDWDGKP